MSYDVVTFGEAMVRLVPAGGARIEQAQQLEVTVGGGELNVAVGCARLGLSAAWVSRLPENPLGRLIRNHGRTWGVDTQHVVFAKDDGRAGLYFVERGASPRAQAVLYDRADSAISRIRPGEVDWKKVFAGAKRFHVSGITPALSPEAAAATAEALITAKAAGCEVSYDLNYRSKLWTPEQARACQEPLMKHVDLLITTEEDTKVVFGIEAKGAGDDSAFTEVKSEGYRAVARRLAEHFGFSGVAVTLRENRSVWQNTWSGLYYDAPANAFHEAPRYELEIVDRVGAGDSFAAGLLASLVKAPGDFARAVHYATAASALKHSIPGDFNIVTPEEVERLMAGGGLRIVR
ncbi:MAG: sugar kinase [Planctomycetes bacterium]|nr:sugar kinase [Planctomycetota bacterium]